MEKILDRFLRYVAVDTQSNEESESQPSAEKELNLLRMLRDELEARGYEVLMIRTPKNLSEIQTLLTDVANRNFVESPHILYQKARKVCVRSEQPLAWTVDGESGGETTDVTLVNHKRAINILTPKEKEYA